MMTSNTTSKRVFGTGIILCGVVVLGAALIIGLQFPKLVYETNLEDVCILSPKHKRYNNWVHDTFREKINRIYYWQVTNVYDVLFNNATPEVFQRGPYVYREMEQKIDVHFPGQRIKFYWWRTQTFDEKLTGEECKHCKEDDRIAIVNPQYAKEVTKFGGDHQYSLFHVPEVISATLDQLTFKSNASGGKDIYEILGNISQPQGNIWEGVKDLPPNLWCVSFGCWVGLNDTTDKTSVLSNREYKSFDRVEMAGLYKVLTDPQLFGANRDTLSNLTYQKQCEVIVYLLNDLSHHDVFATHKSAYPNKREGTIFQAPREPCGFLLCLENFERHRNTAPAEVLLNITNIVAEYLCTNENHACFYLPDESSLRLAVVGMIAEYVFRHIAEYVFYETVVRSSDVIQSKPQCLWATGMCADNQTVDDQAHVVLEHAQTADEARDPTKQVSLLNCYASVGGETNLNWKAFGGKERATSDQFPCASEDDRLIQSHLLNVMPSGNLSACASYKAYKDSFDFFYPEYWRRVAFVPSTKTWHRGTKLDRLLFNASNLDVDERFVMDPGLQNMTGTYGYLSWVSLPHFLYAEDTLLEEYNMQPDEATHRPFVDFEPVSGEVWVQAWRYQHNVGLRRSDVTMSRESVPVRFGYTNKPIPAYWVEKTFTYTKEGQEDYHQRLGRLIKTSCGGLIGLSIVAGIIIIIGFLAATVNFRSNRVAPLQTDEARVDPMM